MEESRGVCGHQDASMLELITRAEMIWFGFQRSLTSSSSTAHRRSQMYQFECIKRLVQKIMVLIRPEDRLYCNVGRSLLIDLHKPVE